MKKTLLDTDITSFFAPTNLDGLDEAQVLNLLAKTYISCLEKFANLDILDFKLDFLKKDVAKTFESAGLLLIERLEA